MQNDNEKKKIKKPSGMRTNFAFQGRSAGRCRYIIPSDRSLIPVTRYFRLSGDEGNGYYGTAYAIYSMILMIATYSIPTAVSKIIFRKAGPWENTEMRDGYLNVLLSM